MEENGIMMTISKACAMLKAEGIKHDKNDKDDVIAACADIGIRVFTGKADKASLLAAVRELLPEAHVYDNLRDDLRVKYKDVTIVPVDDYDMIISMRKSLFGRPHIAKILNAGIFVETSILCEIKVEGCADWIKVKIRPDIITKGRLVPDYKTTRDIEPGAFARSSHDAGYWIRQVFVCDVLSAAYGKKFTPGLIAQEKTEPYISEGFFMDDEDGLSGAREHYCEVLNRYAGYLKRDAWPSYSDKFISLGLPAWSPYLK